MHGFDLSPNPDPRSMGDMCTLESALIFHHGLLPAKENRWDCSITMDTHPQGDLGLLIDRSQATELASLTLRIK